MGRTKGSATGNRQAAWATPDTGSLTPARTRIFGAPADLRAVRGGVGGDIQAAGVRIERHGLDAPDEFGRGRSEDGLPLSQDAAASGRGDQAARSSSL
ncbi:hypothetical protein JJV70_17715 [Streptomyces sp. JJ66]|uniref:hypothetical protein n=1 Tax=Streptomyces sp. JJ66 TaxID=2803843 RepID=UPI001C56BBA3|nr:hypothetical protein [Streptomyces sp. JJ66]MBW1603907.1 hypothetical protein [Streptomyces sp. JJ66]